MSEEIEKLFANPEELCPFGCTRYRWLKEWERLKVEVIANVEEQRRILRKELTMLKFLLVARSRIDIFNWLKEFERKVEAKQ